MLQASMIWLVMLMFSFPGVHDLADDVGVFSFPGVHDLAGDVYILPLLESMTWLLMLTFPCCSNIWPGW